MNIRVIVVAAGSGRRFGGEVPKQFCLLGGRPVLMHTIEAFAEAVPQAQISVVLSADMVDRWREMCQKYDFKVPHSVVEGGATRWESVKHGVEAMVDENPGATVLIHDGARPLVDEKTIKRVIGAAVNTDGALPAVTVTDSLRRVSADGSMMGSEAVDRSDFRAVQTPQGFKLWRLREAYRQPYQKEFTDDASVMAAAGFDNIVLVEGSPRNIKITNPDDLAIAEVLLKEKRKE